MEPSSDATAWRYEFYATVDLPTAIHRIAEHVDAFQHLYNHHRPHGALDGLTPSESISKSAEIGAPTRPRCPESGHQDDNIMTYALRLAANSRQVCVAAVEDALARRLETYQPVEESR